MPHQVVHFRRFAWLVGHKGRLPRTAPSRHHRRNVCDNPGTSARMLDATVAGSVQRLMELRSDFQLREVVYTPALPWSPSPLAGVERRMLDCVGQEVARATSMVRYAHSGDHIFLKSDKTILALARPVSTKP